MIKITEGPIDVEQVIDATHTPKAGGHVHFVGTVREEGDLKGIFYECYPPMAERVLQQIVSEASKKWPVEKISMAHRYGWVPLGEASVVVAVSSAHRREAFMACQYVMDQVKERVPIWKRETITGVILAGGRSSRFGTNKALASVGGRRLVERVADVMRGIFPNILVVTNTPDDYAFLDLPLVTDLVPYQGPLGAIVTAFQAAQHDRIFVVACDLPLLRADRIREIIRQARGHEAVIPVHDGVREYLMALYSRSVVGEAEACLQRGVQSMHEFCDSLDRVAYVPIEGATCVNVNEPRDLERLEGRDAS